MMPASRSTTNHAKLVALAALYIAAIWTYLDSSTPREDPLVGLMCGPIARAVRARETRDSDKRAPARSRIPAAVANRLNPGKRCKPYLDAARRVCSNPTATALPKGAPPPPPSADCAASRGALDQCRSAMSAAKDDAGSRCLKPLQKLSTCGQKLAADGEGPSPGARADQCAPLADAASRCVDGVVERNMKGLKHAQPAKPAAANDRNLKPAERPQQQPNAPPPPPPPPPPPGGSAYEHGLVVAAEPAAAAPPRPQHAAASDAPVAATPRSRPLVLIEQQRPSDPILLVKIPSAR